MPYPPLQITYRLQNIYHCVSSWSLSTVSVHRDSISLMTLQNWSLLRRSLIWQENFYFSISGKISTEVVCTTRAKASFHKKTQTRIWEFPRSTVSSNTWTHTNPIVTIIRKLTLAFWTARFHLYLGHRIHSCPFLPHSPGLVHGHSFAWRTFNVFPFRRWQIGHDNALVAQAGKISTWVFQTKRAEFSSHTKKPRKQ